MASDVRRVLARVLALALTVGAAACGDLDESDILGALAASPPAADEDRAAPTDSVCSPPCDDGRTCVRGRCVEIGDEEDCDPACAYDECRVCDLSSGDHPQCVPLCDPAVCEECDGEGSCLSTCDDDEICVQGDCAETSGGACANTTDLRLFAANPDYDPLLHALECGVNQCGDESVSCIADCMANGDQDELGRAPSEDCARCFAEGILCIAERCAAVCVTSLDDATCVICTEVQCLGDFCDCAGAEVDPRCGGVTL